MFLWVPAGTIVYSVLSWTETCAFNYRLVPEIGHGLNSLWAHMIMNIFKDKAIFFFFLHGEWSNGSDNLHNIYTLRLGDWTTISERQGWFYLFIFFFKIGSAGCLANGGQLGNCYKSQNPNVYSAIRAFSGSYYVDRGHNLSFNRVQAAGNISRKS